MKSKYFGEFLVEKNVISEDNLVNALVEQISTTPPLCQVIFQNKILASKKIFDAFRFQQDNQVEFIQACKTLGFWTQDVQEKTFSALNEIRKPLGHILVSRGLIDLKKLTNMLDEFLSQVSSEISSSPTLTLNVPEVKSVKTPTVIEEQVKDYQPGILMELDETFDEKKKKMIRIALSMIKDNAGIDPTICRKLMLDVFKIVHALNGLLGLLAVEKLSELLEGMELYLTGIQQKFDQSTKEQLIAYTDILIKGIDLAWALRLSILANSTEKVFFQDGNNKAQYGQIVQVLKG